MTSSQLREHYAPWIQLRLTDGLTTSRFAELIGIYESPAAILGVGVERLCAEAGLARPLAEAISRGIEAERIEQEFEAIERLSARLVCINDSEYPLNLKHSASPPPLLYYLGDLQEVDRFALAIVGTRRFSQYGRLACERLCGRLSEAGLTIVSGMARGIDSIAHQTALRYDGRTLAVLGNGLNHCYPAENQGLLEAIAANGAIISEYPMATEPERYHFPERNRIIAGLSLGIVVVEAPAKSGALITADHALEDNREVYAVPGDVTRVASEGANRLIQRGAKLVLDGDDIINDLRFLLADLLQEGNKKAHVETLEGLDELQRRIYELIAPEPLHIDVLLQSFSPDELSISRLSGLLFQLEMKNLVKQLPGQIYAIP